MKFNELDNEEIVFVYTLLADMLGVYDNAIKDKGMNYVVDSPLGKVKVFKEFTDEELEAVRTSDKVRLFSSTSAKLKPIVELIADADPALLDKVEDILSINDKPTDESEEEDL